MSGRIDFQRLRDDYPLEDAVRRAGIRLIRAGVQKVALCPFHVETTPSFNLYDDGKSEHFHCYGCGAHGDVVEFVRRLYKVEIVEAVRILEGEKAAPRRYSPLAAAPVKDKAAEIAKAQAIYRAASPAGGTFVETYLRSRGIDPERLGGVPASLRFDHLKFWQPVSGSNRMEMMGIYPAMIAPIQQPDGAVNGVHLTYLAPDGRGKLALADPFNPGKTVKAKKIRGEKQGGCIRLGPAGPVMMMAEGIETALSVKTVISGTRWDQPVWTFVDLDNLSRISPPPALRRLMILADNDMHFPSADKPRDLRAFIRDTARALTKARKGLQVTVAWPPVGKDCNDMLREMVRG